MKKCPFCSAEILDEAEFCLYCMRQLTPKKSVEITTKKYPWRNVFLCTAIVLLIGTIIFAIIKLAPNDNNVIVSSDSSITNGSVGQNSDTFLSSATSLEDNFDDDNIDANQPEASNKNNKEPVGSESGDTTTEDSSTNNTTSEEESGDDDTPISSKDDTTDDTSTNSSVSQPISTPSEEEKPQNQPMQTWSIKEVDGGIEITGIANHNATGNYEIPSQINGKDVIGIGNSAFNGEEIKTITLPNTLEYIDEQAFSNCCSIMQIVIPRSVTKIRSGAFVPCKNLSNIYIESTNVEIATYAFSSMYQRDVSLTIHAPIGVVDALFARITWDAEYEEWNG